MKKSIFKLFACFSAFVVYVAIISMAISNSSINASTIEQTPFPCGTCGGKGTITDIYGNKITCTHCNGTKTEPQQKPERLTPTKFPDVSKNCSGCDGKGGWNTSSGWVKCSKCNGTGKANN